MARGMWPISSYESALKVTYGNVGVKKIFSPAAGFRPSFYNFFLQNQSSVCLFFPFTPLSENMYSLTCFTIEGTLIQLQLILLFIFHFISFFQFLHLVFIGVRLLACLHWSDWTKLKCIYMKHWSQPIGPLNSTTISQSISKIYAWAICLTRVN